MARPKKEDIRKSLFGKKLEALKGDMNNLRFCEYFEAGLTAFSKYLNGDSTPSMAKIQEFVLNYAADHQMLTIDLNWLLNDADRRLRPVFTNQPVGDPVPGDEDDDSLPEPNGVIQYGALDLARKAQSFPVVGKAAADESRGDRAGIFAADAAMIWDDVEIPETTHFVKILGDSMAPMLMDGQYAMVGPEYTLPYSAPGEREIVVAEVTPGMDEDAAADRRFEGVYCKRVRDAEASWLFESINHTGAPFTILKRHCRLWPVIGVYFAGKGKPPKED